MYELAEIGTFETFMGGSSLGEMSATIKRRVSYKSLIGVENSGRRSGGATRTPDDNDAAPSTSPTDLYAGLRYCPLEGKSYFRFARPSFK